MVALRQGPGVQIVIVATSCSNGVYIEVSHLMSEGCRLKLTDPRPIWVSDCHIFSNQHADEHAGIALQRFCVSFVSVHTYWENYELALRKQKRFIAIVKHSPDRGNVTKDENKRDANPPSSEELISETEHALQHAGTRYICMRCRSGFSSRYPQFKRWLSIPCRHNF